MHALAHAANSFLGNVGKTVFYSDPIEANSVDQTQSLRELVGDIDGGRVETLIILGGNPAYNTPVDLRLDFNRLEKVKLRAHLHLYNNETSEICHWHINAAHYLESWGDARAYDGTASIVQPLIAPLYEGRTAYEVLALVLGQLRSASLTRLCGIIGADSRQAEQAERSANRVSTASAQQPGVSTGSGSDRVAHRQARRRRINRNRHLLPPQISKPGGASVSMTDSYPTLRFRPKLFRRKTDCSEFARARIAPAAQANALRSHLPSRSVNPRRSLRQQRLVAGTA